MPHRSHKPHRAKVVRIPGVGRVILTRDPGDAALLSSEVFASNLMATHRDGDGQLIHEYDLGSGLVTNVGVTALANDFAWAQNCQTLRLANWHATGTGAIAPSASDIRLQTVSTHGGQVPIAGIQSLVSAANTQIYQTVGALEYTGNEAVTEWGLHTSNVLSSSAGSPLTSTTGSSATATGTPYTASSSSVRGQQQSIVVAGGTPVYGLVLANSTAVLTICGWYSVADGTSGSTPGSSEPFTIAPVMWDRKVFSPINVVLGDSIQFSYSLTVHSGG